MDELAIKTPEEMTAEELGGEIRALTRQFKGLILTAGIQIGYRLTLAHEKVGPHGWAEWLKRETEFSAPAASRFEKLYAGYGADQSSFLGIENKFPTLEKISISNALSLLAIPENEREEFAAEVDAEHLSNRALEKAIKERDEARAAAKLAEEERDSSEKLRAELGDAYQSAQSRIRELENRPVEVAVERDEEAIREAAESARKEAERAAKEKIADAKGKLKAAEEKLKAAEERAAAADAQTKETAEALEKARAELAKGEDVEALKKRLEKAESGTGEAAIYCRAAQQNMAQAIERVKAMHETHPDTAGKLAAGLMQILEAMRQDITNMTGGW